MSHLQAALPAQAAAAADVTTTLGPVDVTDDSGAYVTRCVLVPPAGFATVTGVATNNATISFRQLRGGSVVTTFAAVTLNAGTSLTAETVLVVPITGGATLLQDDVVDVILHQNGTGIAIGAGVIADCEIA